MSLYGVQLDVSCMRLVHDMRMAFSHANGGWQVRTMSQGFHQRDAKRQMTISVADFEDVLRSVNIIKRSADIQALARYFDRFNDGQIDYHEFLSKLR